MINNKNFLEIATKAYSNPCCLSINEFLEDLARIKYVKRLLNRYVNTGKIQERLILNHLISLYNVFEIEYITKLLFFRCDKKTWPALKTFLEFLNYLPLEIYDNIDTDEFILQQLHKL